MFALKDKTLLRRQCFVDGRWIDGARGAVINVTNPATGQVIGTVPRLGAAETRTAIEAANRAYPAWRGRPAAERSSLLRRWFELILENREDLAVLMTAEQGKPMAESRGEIAYAASFIEWFAEEGKRIYGDTIPTFAPDKRVIVVKEPVGVCAAITPWNFPSSMITRKAGPALAAGCTMVVKPAGQTPCSALALAVLAERAGIPAGVFNVVTGDSDAIGREMTGNPMVRKFSFTGSTETGRRLMKQCAGTIKKVSLDSAETPPLSCSTTRIWMRPSKGPWSPSIATPARHASAPTAFSFRTGSTRPCHEAHGAGRSIHCRGRFEGRDAAGPPHRHACGREGRSAHCRRRLKGRPDRYGRQAA